MKKLVFIAISILLALLYDLGNPDALRQGTEGFYLQVASEMFQKNSLMTPYYLDHPHWSKPPLLFLLPQALYYIFGSSTLFFSRFSVLFFSIFVSFIVSKKVSKLTGIKDYAFLLLAFSSLGFFKYSRIFMMEMPLLILSFAGALYFYSFLESKNNKDLVWAIVWSALSCQVKGPVSLFMLGVSFSVYAIYHFLVFKRFHLKEISLWAFGSLLLSSAWFLHQYSNFGRDFIDYFFLRENLGKFSSKSYPISSVFQGLIFYALPWSILIPSLFWQIKRKGIEKLSSQSSKFYVFLLICFGCFFTIWLIPQQRSHHYALPAIPFLLLIIYLEFFSNSHIPKIVSRFFKVYTSFFLGLGILLASITFLLMDQFQNATYLSISIGLSLLVLSTLLAFKKESSPENLFLSHVVLITVFWSVFIPNYILPLVPSAIQENTKSFLSIGTVHRKPYFISQSLGRDIEILNIDAVSKFLTQEKSAVIIEDTFFKLLPNTSKYKILNTWPVWRRGIKPKEIYQNLKTKNLNKLRSSIYLISI